MRILIACERSGVVRQAFRNKGHDAWSCDLVPADDNSPYHIQDDVLKHLDDGWDMLIAHPPCTYLTVTGNKWFKPEFKERFPNRTVQRQEAIEFFLQLARCPIHKKALENLVGIMSRLYRKPDQIIQPFYFGHIEAKKTCLWLTNLPLLRYGDAIQMRLGETHPPTLTEVKEPAYTVFKSGKRMATWYVNATKGKDRSDIRSRTFDGVARAMAEQWG